MAEQAELKIASKESVAYQMAQHLITTSYNDAAYKKDFLDLYAECLKAAKGNRQLGTDGPNSVEPN